MAGENGRWLIGVQSAAGLLKEIWVSDNNGSTWVKKYTASTAGNTFGFADAFRMGNILFFGGSMTGSAADSVGVISFNNGDDWETLANTGQQHQGFVFDPRFNLLFVNMDGTEEIRYMLHPRSTSDWIAGIESGILAAMGDGGFALVENGLAVQGTT